MSIAPKPSYESQRVAALRSLRMMGTPAEERFDRIVRLAKRLFAVPYAAVNLIGDDELYAKAQEGGLPGVVRYERETTYCQWTLEGEEAHPVIIEDSFLDPRTAGNPNAKDFRFYAGVPLTYSEQPVGTLCVGGMEPREFSPDELEILQDLSVMVEKELQNHQLSKAQLELAEELQTVRAQMAIDGLTHTWNRTAILDIAARELAFGTCAFLLVDIDHFKSINDAHGHQAGDEVLRRVADRLRTEVRKNDAVGRYGGEEFLMVLPGARQYPMEVIAERVRAAIAATPIVVGDKSIAVTVSIGGCVGQDPESASNPTIVLKAADEALYDAKNTGRNRVVSKRVTQSLYMRAVKLPPSDS